jgi:hypothetical protein
MSSSSGGRWGGRFAIFFGILAVAAIPAGIVISWRRTGVTLLEGIEGGVAAAFLLALLAIYAARRGRIRVEKSLNRRGARLVRAGRMLAWTGLYLAAAGGIALGFYGLLVMRG